MAADETKLLDLAIAQWESPGAENPRLSTPVSKTATTLVFTNALLDEDGAQITKAVIIGVKDIDTGYTENIKIPAGGLSADGLTATGCIRGLQLAGINGINTGTAVTANAVKLGADSEVRINVGPHLLQSLMDIFLNDLATGGLNLVIGDLTNSTVTIKRRGTGAALGFVRYNISTSKVQFSNDGTNWINHDNAGVGVLTAGRFINAVALALGTVQVDNNYALTTGSADAYVATIPSTTAIYTTGEAIRIKANFTNTGAATIAVNGGAAKAIIRKDGSTALAANDIVSGLIYELIYDGTSFRLTQAIPDTAVAIVAGGAASDADTMHTHGKFKFGGTGADGAQGDADLTITGSNNTYIEKNFTSWAAGSIARICTVTPTGCIVHIKIAGDADFTNWAFNFNGKGMAGGAGGAENTTRDGLPGTAGIAVILSTVPILIGGGDLGAGGGDSAGDPGDAISVSPNVFVGADMIKAGKTIVVSPGAGGGGGSSGSTSVSGNPGGAGGAGGAGGGCVIIEVAGNVTFSSTTATVAGIVGVAGSNGQDGAGDDGSGGGGGGGGGGGSFVLLYNGAITGSLTPTVTAGGGGAGGTGGTDTGGINGGTGGSGGASLLANSTAGSTYSTKNGGAGGAGGVGMSLVAKNTIF